MTLKSLCGRDYESHPAHRWTIGSTVYHCEGVMDTGYERAIQAVRQDERERLREYIESHVTHCNDCAKVQAYQHGADPSDYDCTCTKKLVTNLFDKYEEQR